MRVTLTALTVLVAACAQAAPVPPERIAQEKLRLLQPFLEQREIGCDTLLIELSPIFDANVTRPALDPLLHRRDKRSTDAYDETEWVNLGGDPAAAFRVQVVGADLEAELASGRPTSVSQGTIFTVLRSVTVRVHRGLREFTLDARAQGEVLVLERGQVRELQEFRVHDGRVHAR